MVAVQVEKLGSCVVVGDLAEAIKIVLMILGWCCVCEYNNDAGPGVLLKRHPGPTEIILEPTVPFFLFILDVATHKVDTNKEDALPVEGKVLGAVRLMIDVP